MGKGLCPSRGVRSLAITQIAMKDSPAAPCLILSRAARGRSSRRRFRSRWISRSTAVGERACVAEYDADVIGEAGGIVESEGRPLQHETVEQGHHHPGRAVRVQLGRDAARLLAVTECFGDALANVAKSAGLSDPRIYQSMYIFKQPHIGGEVRWHLKTLPELVKRVLGYLGLSEEVYTRLVINSG